MKVRPWWWLALGVIVLQAGATLAFVWNTPPGLHWLGANILNSADTTLYLSLIRQVADGHIAVAQLFNAGRAMPEIYPFWIVLGLIARVGLSPMIVYELGRFACGIFLAWTIWVVAHRTFEQERDARLASFLALCGIGTGWIYAMWEIASHADVFILDLHSEFAVGPILFSSGHIALSTGLLLLGLSYMWDELPKDDLRMHWKYLAIFAALFLFHPYFILLYGVYGIILGIRAFGWRGIFRPRFILTHVLPVMPALLLYIPLFLDPAFRVLNTVANDLPLSAPSVIAVILIPFLFAFAWRYARRVGIKDKERWLLAWLMAALISLFFPVPWKRKLLEGADIALVFLSMPLWIWIRDRLWRKPVPILTITLSLLLLCLAAGDVLYLEVDNLVRAASPLAANAYYADDDLMAAWSYIHTHTSTDTAVAVDDFVPMQWTPAYTGRHVWLGHAQGTTDFNEKYAAWSEFVTTEDGARAAQLAEHAGVTYIITTTPGSALRFKDLLEPYRWQIVYMHGDATILERIDSE